MNDYKRKKQITEEEIYSFKDVEFNKLMTKVEGNDDPRFSKSVIYTRVALLFTFSALLVVFLITSNIASNKDNNYFQVIKVNAQEYMVESNNDGNMFYMYYKTYIVYENERVSFDDTLDYNVQYRYVQSEVANEIEIAFDAFRLDDYRYFYQTTIEGETNYFEVDYLPGLTREAYLDQLEIDEYEEDIKAVFDLIKAYPPVLQTETGDTYLINDQINNLPDSKSKRNYIAYVTNHYLSETDFESSEGTVNQEKIVSFIQNNIVVLDDDNNVERSTNNSHIYVGSHVTLDSMHDIIIDSFNFYQPEELYGLTQGKYYFNDINSIIDGRVSDFRVGNQRYVYGMINLAQSQLNLTNVSYAEIDYILHDYYGEVGLRHVAFIDVIYHDGKLVIPPIMVVESENLSIVSLFKEISVSLYDEDGNAIYEFDVIKNY